MGTSTQVSTKTEWRKQNCYVVMKNSPHGVNKVSDGVVEVRIRQCDVLHYLVHYLHGVLRGKIEKRKRMGKD